MAGPLSIGVAIPGLVDFSMGPLTGMQVRLFDALAPRPQPQVPYYAPTAASTAATAQPAAVSQLSVESMAASLSQQLAERLQKLYEANPSLAATPLGSIQVRYSSVTGTPELLIGPLADGSQTSDPAQLAAVLQACREVLAKFLTDNDAALRQVAAANGGVVNLNLTATRDAATEAAAVDDEDDEPTPATAAGTPGGWAVAIPGLALSYGAYPYPTGYGGYATAAR
jgi:hypothetical protein